MMFSHVAITVTYSAVVPGERTVVAIPRSSVRTVVSERFTWVEFVANVTTPLETGLPSRSTLTVITAISAEFAVIMVALACTETIPTAIVTGVDWVRVPHSAVIVVVPVVVPGVKVTVASPWASVVAVAEERIPRVGAAEKVTVSPTSGFPFRATCAAIVEVMVEPAAKVDGFAETDRVPEAIVTEIDLETLPQVAVTTAVPGVGPGLRLTVAIPLELVISIEELSVPKVVVKVTGTLAAKIPIKSRTVTVIVDVMAEPAAITVGTAVITICGSLTRTASNGMVCP